MNFKYIFLRLIRHFLPTPLTHFLLARNWIIKAGSETSTPTLAVKRYQVALDQAGQTLNGKRVMVFGYGGSFAVGCGLLRAGAAHVVMCDKYAGPDDHRNRLLLPEYGDYLVESQGHIVAHTDIITVLTEDIQCIAAQGSLLPLDIVLSTHVYEHLDDVDGSTRSLVALTTSGGLHLHFIDIRDHFFKYPFKMLTFTEQIWHTWLNPGSNLNRYRITDYRRAFQNYFKKVDIAVFERNRYAFEQVRNRIRPEFITGDIETDAATQIRVVAYA